MSNKTKLQSIMGAKDWFFLIIVAILGVGVYVLFHDKINNAALVTTIAVIGYVIGKLSKTFTGN
ncbi:hypothetical protein [Exiguobacterium sp.]|uniref:hypothetical protein n=1 Tax=Exiguobacterium sp. TaxID=44751 RepID=UPI00263BBEB6|nr:hypothetical protein [Exiguobacterium sp.]MCC5892637.1 hypothetical protein [Exiguobacterium sp.]